MTGDLRHKGKLPEHVVAPEGTSLFKTVNFERYAVSLMRHILKHGLSFALLVRNKMV